MVNRSEAIGVLASITIMALALLVLNNSQHNGIFSLSHTRASSAASVVLAGSGNDQPSMSAALSNAVDRSGTVQKLIINDVQIGSGAAIKTGDSVTVNYIGTLQNGQQFDNSYLKGKPYTFTVGAGDVIKGWDRGLAGMKVGGQRILVIPPSLAYGAQGAGPIPGNATLVFAIELESINK